jgi:hypothetical protein
MEQITGMKSILSSMIIVLLTFGVFQFCAFPAASAEFPKTGEAEYDTYYVANGVADFDSGAGTGAIFDETGITRMSKEKAHSTTCLFAACTTAAR